MLSKAPCAAVSVVVGSRVFVLDHHHRIEARGDLPGHARPRGGGGAWAGGHGGGVFGDAHGLPEVTAGPAGQGAEPGAGAASLASNY